LKANDAPDLIERTDPVALDARYLRAVARKPVTSESPRGAFRALALLSGFTETIEGTTINSSLEHSASYPAVCRQVIPPFGQQVVQPGKQVNWHKTPSVKGLRSIATPSVPSDCREAISSRKPPNVLSTRSNLRTSEV
jgi:hypothetical protein